MKQRLVFLAYFLGTIAAGCVVNAEAQANDYQQINLVSSVPGMAAQTNINLVNPWGIARVPGEIETFQTETFFIADNHRGSVRTFDQFGDSVAPGLFALFPSEKFNPTPTTPSGIVSNPTEDFVLNGFASEVLIATEDGTISGWASENGDLPEFATKAIDNSLHGAVYKGIAVLTPACCAPFLVVTNFNSGFIEPYTSFFAPLAPPGSFTDPTLPAGYAPFGIQVIGEQVFVTYALQDAIKHDPAVGVGRGIVNIFDLEGNFVRRFATHGSLNAPWGVVKASAHFGPFSNDILIGNFGDGTIGAFDPETGKFLGRLKAADGKIIANSGLWGMVFGAGATADANTLYFTAGLNHGSDGLFGAISLKK